MAVTAKRQIHRPKAAEVKSPEDALGGAKTVGDATGESRSGLPLIVHPRTSAAIREPILGSPRIDDRGCTAIMLSLGAISPIRGAVIAVSF